MKKLKKQTFGLLFFFVTLFSLAQDKPKSPKETATGTINSASVSVEYGSPSVRGRKIWGDLVPLDKIWRAGANAATTLSTDKDLTIDGQRLPAGKYSIFIIPNALSSTIIFNKVAALWGTTGYDEKQDQLRIKIKPIASETSVEKMIFLIQKNNVTLSWEKWSFVIPVQ